MTVLKYRIFSGFGALLLLATSTVFGAGRASAASTKGPISDTVTLAAKVFVVQPPAPGAAGFALVTSTTCSLKSDLENAPVSCGLSGSASLTLSGGTLTGSISSTDGTVSFTQTFVYSTDTTLTGTGADQELDTDDGVSSVGTATLTGTLSSPLTDVGEFVDLTASTVFQDNLDQPGDADNTSPTCQVTALRPGPPKQQDVTVQDTGSGHQSITNIQITNGTVHVPAFTAATTAPVMITATKTNQSQRTLWSFDATNVAGVTTHCA